MALIETEDSIKEYYNQVKDQYPNIPFEQFRQICKVPFRFFKSKIQGEDMPTIHMKFFGKFKVFETRILTLLKKLEHLKKFNRISSDRYASHKEHLEYRLKTIRDNDTLRSSQTNTNRTETTN